MSRRADALAAYRAERIAELGETRPRSQRRAELTGVLRATTTDLLRAELAERRRAARRRPDTTRDLLSAAE
jgi:hypothetical protein